MPGNDVVKVARFLKIQLDKVPPTAKRPLRWC
jgi:hypothetical protein